MESRKINEIYLIIIPTKVAKVDVVADLKKRCHYIVSDQSGVQKGLPIYKPAKIVKGHNKHSIVVVYITDNVPKDVCDNIKDFNIIHPIVKELSFRYNLDVQTLYYDENESK